MSTGGFQNPLSRVFGILDQSDPTMPDSYGSPQIPNAPGANPLANVFGILDATDDPMSPPPAMPAAPAEMPSAAPQMAMPSEIPGIDEAAANRRAMIEKFAAEGVSGSIPDGDYLRDQKGALLLDPFTKQPQQKRIMLTPEERLHAAKTYYQSKIGQGNLGGVEGGLWYMKGAPLIGGVTAVADASQTASSFKAIENDIVTGTNTATEQDYLQAGRAIAAQEEARRPQGFMQQVGEGIYKTAGLAGDMVVSGGAAAIGKKAGSSAAKQIGQAIAADAAKGSAWRSAGRLAQAGVQTASGEAFRMASPNMLSRAVAGSIDRATDRLDTTGDGQIEAMKTEGETPFMAIVKGFGSQYAEQLGEASGGGLSRLGGIVGKSNLAKAIAETKLGQVARQVASGMKVPAADRIRRAAMLDGLPQELAEERVTELLQSPIDGPTGVLGMLSRGEYEQAARQIGVEAATIGVTLGAAQGGAKAVQSIAEDVRADNLDQREGQLRTEMAGGDLRQRQSPVTGNFSLKRIVDAAPQEVAAFAAAAEPSRSAMESSGLRAKLRELDLYDHASNADGRRQLWDRLKQFTAAPEDAAQAVPNRMHSAMEKFGSSPLTSVERATSNVTLDEQGWPVLAFEVPSWPQGDRTLAIRQRQAGWTLELPGGERQPFTRFDQAIDAARGALGGKTLDINRPYVESVKSYMEQFGKAKRSGMKGPPVPPELTTPSMAGELPQEESQSVQPALLSPDSAVQWNSERDKKYRGATVAEWISGVLKRGSSKQSLKTAIEMGDDSSNVGWSFLPVNIREQIKRRGWSVVWGEIEPIVAESPQPEADLPLPGQEQAQQQGIAPPLPPAEIAIQTEAVPESQGSLQSDEKQPTPPLPAARPVQRLTPPPIERIEDDPIVRMHYEAPAGVSEGYTVGEHSLEVLRNFDEQADREAIDAIGRKYDIRAYDTVRAAVALHDIGKGRAVKEGKKSLQHRYTIPILRQVMKGRMFTGKEIDAAAALVGNDAIGLAIQGKLAPQKAAEVIRAASAKAGMSPQDYFDLQSMYYKSDAASYPSLRSSLFATQGDKLKIAKEPYGILEELIHGQVRETPWVGRGGENGRVEPVGGGGNRGAGEFVHGTAVKFDRFSEEFDSGKNRVGPGAYLLDEKDADVAEHYSARAYKRLLSLFTPKTRVTLENADSAKLESLAEMARQRSEAARLDGDEKNAGRWAQAEQIVSAMRDGRLGKHVLSAEFSPKKILDMGADESGGRLLTEQEASVIRGAAPGAAMPDTRRAFALYDAAAVAVGKARVNEAIKAAGYDAIHFVHKKGGYSRPYSVFTALSHSDAVPVASRKASRGISRNVEEQPEPTTPASVVEQPQAKEQSDAPRQKEGREGRAGLLAPVAEKQAEPSPASTPSDVGGGEAGIPSNGRKITNPKVGDRVTYVDEHDDQRKSGTITRATSPGRIWIDEGRDPLLKSVNPEFLDLEYADDAAPSGEVSVVSPAVRGVDKPIDQAQGSTEPPVVRGMDKPSVSVKIGEVPGGEGRYDMEGITLDRESLRHLSKEKRAELIRHEMAHAASATKNIWSDAAGYFWDLWSRDKRHPLWDYMAERLPNAPTRFDHPRVGGNVVSEELIAHLYSEDYPNGAFTIQDRSLPYAYEDTEDGGPYEYEFDDELQAILDRIEAELGIWSKKAERSGRAEQAQVAAEPPAEPPVVRGVEKPTATSAVDKIRDLRDKGLNLFTNNRKDRVALEKKLADFIGNKQEAMDALEVVRAETPVSPPQQKQKSPPSAPSTPVDLGNGVVITKTKQGWTVAAPADFIERLDPNGRRKLPGGKWFFRRDPETEARAELEEYARENERLAAIEGRGNIQTRFGEMDPESWREIESAIRERVDQHNAPIIEKNAQVKSLLGRDPAGMLLNVRAVKRRGGDPTKHPWFDTMVAEVRENRGEYSHIEPTEDGVYQAVLEGYKRPLLSVDDSWGEIGDDLRAWIDEALDRAKQAAAADNGEWDRNASDPGGGDTSFNPDEFDAPQPKQKSLGLPEEMTPEKAFSLEYRPPAPDEVAPQPKDSRRPKPDRQQVLGQEFSSHDDQPGQKLLMDDLYQPHRHQSPKGPHEGAALEPPEDGEWEHVDRATGDVTYMRFKSGRFRLRLIKRTGKYKIDGIALGEPMTLSSRDKAFAEHERLERESLTRHPSFEEFLAANERSSLGDFSHDNDGPSGSDFSRGARLSTRVSPSVTTRVTEDAATDTANAESILKPQVPAKWATDAPKGDYAKQIAAKMDDEATDPTPSIGPAHIMRFLGDRLHASLHYVNSQLPGRRGVFKRINAVIFGRSPWEAAVTIHELGHALSRMTADKSGISANVTEWHATELATHSLAKDGITKPSKKQIKDRASELGDLLLQLTDPELTPDGVSMASAATTEEGMGEFVRRYVMRHGTLDSFGELRPTIESYLETKAPDVLEALQDAHRLWVKLESRPTGDRAALAVTERLPPPETSARVSQVARKAAVAIVGPSAGEKMRGITIYNATKKGAEKAGVNDPVSVARAVRQRFGYDTARGYSSTPDSAFGVWAQAQSLVPSEEKYALTTHIRVALQKKATPFRVVPDSVDDWSNADRNAASSTGVITESQLARFEKLGVYVPLEAVKPGDYVRLSQNGLREMFDDLKKNGTYDKFDAYRALRTSLYRHKKAADKAKLDWASDLAAVQRLHPYPGIDTLLKPTDVEAWLRETERQHPYVEGGSPGFRNHYDTQQQFLRQLLMIDILSGERSAEEVLRMMEAHTEYSHIPRRILNDHDLDGFSAAVSGGLDISSGVKRARGSELPYLPMVEAMVRRASNALSSYYEMATIRAGLAMMDELDKPINVDGKQVMLDYGMRKFLQRQMVKVAPDPVVVATLLKSDAAVHKIQEYMAQKIGEALGEEINPAELDLDLDDFSPTPVMRAKRPKMPNVLGYFDPAEPGVRKYVFVPDPATWMTLTYLGGVDSNWLSEASKLARAADEPMRKHVTNTLGFVFNNFIRDPMSFAMFSESVKEGLTPMIAAVAAFRRAMKPKLGMTGVMKGDMTEAWEDAAVIGKMLTNDITPDTTTAKGRYVEHAFGSWSKWSADDPVLRRASVVVKNMTQAGLQGPLLFSGLMAATGIPVAGESLHRVGAKVLAKERGASDLEAQLAFAKSTGFFAQRGASKTARDITGGAMFLNPAMQGAWQGMEALLDLGGDRQKAALLALKTTMAMTAGAAAAVVARAMLGVMPGSDEEKRKLLINANERSESDRLRRAWFPVYTPWGGTELVASKAGGGPLGVAFHYGFDTAMTKMTDGGRAVGPGAVALRAWEEVPYGTPYDAIPRTANIMRQFVANYDDFRNQDVESDWMRRDYYDHPEFRTTDRDPGLTKLVAESLAATGLPSMIRPSPVRLRFLAEQIGGSDSIILMEWADYLAGKSKQRPRIPLTSGLLLGDYTGRYGQSARDVYDDAQKAESARNAAYLAIEKQQDPTPYWLELKELGGALAAQAVIEDKWKRVTSEMGKPSSDEEEIRRLKLNITETAIDYRMNPEKWRQAFIAGELAKQAKYPTWRASDERREKMRIDRERLQSKQRALKAP